MRNILTLLLALVSWSAFSKDCDYRISVANSTIQITDIDQMIQRDFSLFREKGPNGNRDCLTYRVYFGKGLANSYQRKAFSASGRSINYNLHRLVNKAGILKEVGDALNANEFIEGSAPFKDTTYQNNFFVSVPGIEEQNYPKSDYYWDSVQVTIYGYVDDRRDFVFEQSTNLTLLFIVSTKIDISLVDEGAAFDSSATSKVLDFGFLTQYQEKSVDLRVMSNTPYQIKASSGNNSALKHASQNSLINYSMKVNGSGVSLSASSSNPATIGSGGITSSSGDRYNLRFQILSNTSNMPSGLYQDSITITAIAN